MLQKAFLKDMVARRSGKILNVASLTGMVPCPHIAVYAATKAFLISFSQSVARELRGTGVTITVLCPGATKTPMYKLGFWLPSWPIRATMMVPETVAAVGFEALMKGRCVVVPGLLNKFWSMLPRILPMRWTLELTHSLIGGRCEDQSILP